MCGFELNQSLGVSWQAYQLVSVSVAQNPWSYTLTPPLSKLTLHPEGPECLNAVSPLTEAIQSS